MSRRQVKVQIDRATADEPGFLEVFDLLLGLHAEGGYAPLDPTRAAENCYRVLIEGMAFVARIDGAAVGTIALTELPFWYATETFLQDAWLFVRPEFRAGRVGVALIAAVKAEAEARNKIVFVTVNNPDRRPKRTTASLDSQTVGFVPIGYTMKVR